jgi:hypothetical protein
MDLRAAVEQVCEQHKDAILDPGRGVIIPDTDQELNWHAFLAHSLDMQGFRADWFVGRQPDPNRPCFRTLWDRRLGVPELAALWDSEAIRVGLGDLHRHGVRTVEDAARLLDTEGGEHGRGLAEALRTFHTRKNIRTVRAYLQNSHKLKDYRLSFRQYLAAKVSSLTGSDVFPPRDFMAPVRWGDTPVTLESALARCLERDFYMVGPEIAAYMLCDWMLGLWRTGKTGMFESIKWDSRNTEFFERCGQQVKTKEAFLSWFTTQSFDFPPRVANEAIWLEFDSQAKESSCRPK